ncbi:MAG TPA: 3-hydroxyacyl-CoA dehydrogenase NAD-binding domain-containing protein [Solirubrobacterales bacterium]|nr:3-hydroxyacyl-CoA dehydrogenase NAD-binding domain-containing protein [Solirubrobacterales bacterium]
MSVSRVGVVGAGTMGRGIAQIAALGGYETVLYDPLPGVATQSAEALRQALEKGAARGRWSEKDAAAAAQRVQPAEDVEQMAGAELAIEAAPERLELKREIFNQLAEVLGPEATLASNTSSLRVSEIAEGVPQPERVVGMHFFNPPPLMKLVEIVATERSSEQALAAATEVGERMGRTPIRAKDSPGFVANRLARPFSLESLRILGDGVADAATIDRIVRLGGGFRMGPFELLDLIGLDVNLEIARSFFAQSGEVERWRPSPIQEQLVAEGKLGRKSGHGYHDYSEGSHRESDPDLGIDAPVLDPDQLAKIDPVAEQVLPRLIAQIANEAAFAQEEQIGSPEDMDTAMKLGFNWPLGPVEFTELIGACRAVGLLEGLEREKGAAYEPAPRLQAEADEHAKSVGPETLGNAAALKEGLRANPPDKAWSRELKELRSHLKAETD